MAVSAGAAAAASCGAASASALERCRGSLAWRGGRWDVGVAALATRAPQQLASVAVVGSIAAGIAAGLGAARRRRLRSRRGSSIGGAGSGNNAAAVPAAARVVARAAGEAGADPSSLVFCFDFDGVVCDSVDESSETAWKHARQLWPKVDFGSSPEPYLAPMRQVRPVVETGWENTVLIRILCEAGVTAPKTERGPAGLGFANLAASGIGTLQGGDPSAPGARKRLKTGADLVADAVLSDWEQMRDARVKEWGLDQQQMIKEFGEIRDKWIEEDQPGWLARNQSYDLVPDCMDGMSESGAEVFIITTKQKRFCAALLKDFGLEFPEANLFALEDGPKTEVLLKLLERPELQGKSFHFIEDKLGTLRKVSAREDLSAVKLHLVDWGYNTERDRKIAKGRVVDGVSLMTIGDLEVLGTGKSWLD